MIKIDLKQHIKLLKKNICFILFILISNLLFTDLSHSLKTSIRLFLAIDYTYIMGCYFDSTSIRVAFKYMFYPLKLFKIDIDSLTLIIAVSLAFIPIFIDEITMIKSSLRSKGYEFNFKHLMYRPHIFLVTFLNNLLDRMDELEKTLIIKAY